ncbi:unnamed protein product [Choristocarpus tenellus]
MIFKHSPTTSPTASPTTSPTTSPTASPTTSPTTSPTAELVALAHFRFSEGGAHVVLALQLQMFPHDSTLCKCSHAVSCHPGRFKGMCLANPDLEPDEASAEIERLHNEGFCGVRFNPYLWPVGQWGGRGMADPVGMAMFRKAGELGMPVGVMCFKGLGMHLVELKALLDECPQTKVIIDHFGFFLQDGKADEDAWSELLGLARYPQVYVKTSAFFRVSKEDYPYPDLRPRVAALMNNYGSKRLLWGSDYPFVEDGQCGYGPAKEAMTNSFGLTTEEVVDVMGGTAETLFGKWGEVNR